MRSRGALVTDIIVLVVAGDEGVKEQTKEAIEQAKQAKVPIVVAINKSDKPDFNPEKVYRELSDQNLLPEIWGGTTITVNCSAITGAGIPELLEMLLLQAEVLELKANFSSRARGTVLESEMHKGLGSTATVLVQNGTLKMGDAIVIGHNWGRVKAMYDSSGQLSQKALPSQPVKISGLSDLPQAGDEFIVVLSEKEAKELAQARAEGFKQTLFQQLKKGSVDLLKESKNIKILTLILKADVQGSLEALKNSLLKIHSEKAELNIISMGVGEISESDIQLAAASKATIFGFHTKAEAHAESMIKELKISVYFFDVIYHAVDQAKLLMVSLLDKLEEEQDIGKAEVKAVFKSSLAGNIAGCLVIDGLIKRNHRIRVIRSGEVLKKSKISSLKKVKEDVKEVQKGMECGILLDNFSDFKEGDILQSYEVTYLEQQL
jgi:translation initiation factor IF-2